MRRRTARSRIVSPLDEDRGIFKGEPVEVSLSLTPFFKESKRGDLIFMGVIDSAEVEIVFPGRRKAEVGALKTAVSRHHIASKGETNFPFQARGIWRTRLVEGDAANAQRVYQFLVSEWVIFHDDGEGTTFGAPPLKE